MIDAALIAARFLHYVAVLALFGAALHPLYGAAPGSAASARLRAWTRALAAWSALAALLTGAAWFMLTAASMAGEPSAAFDPGTLATVVQATSFGPLWLARLGLIAAALLALLVVKGRTSLPWLAPAIAGLALGSLAGVGHGRLPEGAGGAVHALSDAGHLLAAGVWLGGLWPLGAALAWASRAAPGEDHAVGELLMRFSRAGYLAVLALVLTGIVNSWFLVGGIGRLASTAYGRLLILKMALFLAMAALAAANRFWITPALAAEGAAPSPLWLGRIRRHVLLEQTLGLAVIAAVSVLGTLPPAIEG